MICEILYVNIIFQTEWNMIKSLLYKRIWVIKLDRNNVVLNKTT